MGKKQHSQDRMYITATEWKRDFGGHKGTSAGQQNERLPLQCCSLTFQPFEHPVCTSEGHIFELEAIVPYVQKYHKNPVTDQPLELAQLIKLKFARNPETDELQCASTHETFSANTHVVAIRTTGNVYSYDAIDTLCLKPKTLRDLLDDSPFTRGDIITLQDPHNFTNRHMGNFAHIKDDTIARQVAEAKKQAPTSSSSSSSSASKPAPRARPQLGISLAPSSGGASAAAASLSGPARGLYSSGAVSGSFTSTSMSVATDNVRSLLTPEQILEQHYTHLRTTKAKGYVRLSTNLGNLNLELHCDMVPRTCHNFLELCERKYYVNNLVHRVIPGFMFQTGDPDGTGRGGEGAFSREFRDEFHSSLKHDQRGIVAMANSGKDTNGSQFYVTFGPAEHLDMKHSVFGRIVGGFEVLDLIEHVDTIKLKNGPKPKDCPVKDIRITAVQVFTNPFKEEFIPKDELTGRKVGEKEKEKEEETPHEMGKWFSSMPAEALPQQNGMAEDRFKYLTLPKPIQVDAIGATIVSSTAAASSSSSSADSSRPGHKRKESPNGDIDSSATDEDARAFAAAKRQAQLQSTMAQKAQTNSYGNFSNF